MSFASEMIWTAFRQGEEERDRGLSAPEGILRFDDIPYAAGEVQMLDVYRPREGDLAWGYESRLGEETEAGGAMGQEGLFPLPVIVLVHGGGWVYGSKEGYQFYGMSLAQRGFAVVNFSYRLAPEHPFPACLEDVCACFSWVLARGAGYGFDLRHVFGVGDSAGAHLLSLFSCLCTNPDYARGYAFAPPEGFVPTALGLNCGAYTLNQGRRGLLRSLAKDLLPGGGTPEELLEVNALEHMRGNFPPTLYMTCPGDSLTKDQAPLLEKRLEELEVPHRGVFYGDEENKLFHAFHCDIRLEEAKRFNDEECAFFRDFCRS